MVRIARTVEIIRQMNQSSLISNRYGLFWHDSLDYLPFKTNAVKTAQGHD